MASASRPYQGYAESSADFGLPTLPDLGNVSTLLDGTTDQYVWYRSAGYWTGRTLDTILSSAAQRWPGRTAVLDTGARRQQLVDPK